MNQNELKNYRPVANIKFLSKIIEKQVVNELNEHMVKHELGESLQSAYLSGHSTETALLKVKADIMNEIHHQKGVFLVLLDLSAAFDTVKHSILIDRIAHEIGVTGTALNWFRSYFSGRSTQILIDGVYSRTCDMSYGLPQGSIVGPRAFTIYTIPIGRIIKRYNLSYHMYADDIQIYVSFDPNDPDSILAALTSLTNCINEIKSWMTHNMLKLNNDKTEFFIATSPHFKRLMAPVQLQIGNETILPSSSVRNLGIVFDDTMSMSPHITSLSSNITYHLRNISRIRRFLDFDTCNHVVRSLVLGKLDYGNAILLGANTTDIQRLQRLQNWGAKLIFRAAKRDHATGFLDQLHWLPVQNRIMFKVMVYVYKCLNSLAPAYLSNDLSLYFNARPGLRSAIDTTLLTVPALVTRALHSAEDKSFFLATPALWNALPSEVRSSPTLSSFKKALKSHLYPK